jgi:hypothetical protein
MKNSVNPKGTILLRAFFAILNVFFAFKIGLTTGSGRVEMLGTPASMLHLKSELRGSGPPFTPV